MDSADEVFIMMSISKVDIANMCNDRIEDRELNIAPIRTNDPRLTNELCEKIATAFGEIYNDDLSEEDRGAEQRHVIDLVLKKYFS